MAKIDIDASELDDVVENLTRLQGNAYTESGQLADELADDMITFIEESVAKTFDISGDDKSQPSLQGSFYKSYSGDGVTIKSIAPHAGPLEDGVSPHYITPDKAGALNFTPENINEYPEVYRNDDGSVTLGRVYWRPDEAPDGYKYIWQAQREANQFAGLKINSSVKKIIRKSGFSKS